MIFVPFNTHIAPLIWPFYLYYFLLPILYLLESIIQGPTFDNLVQMSIEMALFNSILDYERFRNLGYDDTRFHRSHHCNLSTKHYIKKRFYFLNFICIYISIISWSENQCLLPQSINLNDNNNKNHGQVISIKFIATHYHIDSVSYIVRSI